MREPDFYWAGQPRWRCPECGYDGITERDVDKHRIVHRHEAAFQRQIEAGREPNMEAAIREAAKGAPPSPAPDPLLFDFANRLIKP